MNIVQSYWSKPFLYRSSEHKSIGGWCQKPFFYMSMALSCLSLKKFNSDVELYTDYEGAELWCDLIGLPYSRVHVCLNELDKYPECLWALGKIRTYSYQKEPFIHVDNDIFVWNKFPSEITSAALISQHLESGYKLNEAIIKDIIEKAAYLPDCVKVINSYNESNAGIIGGHDIEFFIEYCKEAEKFAIQNISTYSNFKYSAFFNTVFEQHLFYCLAEYHKKDITYAFSDVDCRFKPFGEYELAPDKRFMIHALAFYKQLFHVGESIAQRLLIEFPSYYERIIQLIRDGKL